MMENRLKLTVKMFSDIVEAVEELEIVERECECENLSAS